MYWRNLLTFILLSIYSLIIGCSYNTGSTGIIAQSSPAASTGTEMSNTPSGCVVYGQPDFTSSTHHGVNQQTLADPGAIHAALDGGFYVADYNNNRVLHFPALNSRGTGPQADQVYGQPDFFSNLSSKDRTGLNSPHGVAEALDGGLYISDMLNDRVLHYPPGNSTADLVYGQPDFTSNGNNTGGLSAASLYHPQGLALDHTGLYVADSANNRVVHYPFGSTRADSVYGQGLPGNDQASFTRNSSGYGMVGLNNPRDIAIDSTGLYVVDSGNNRVVHYTVGNPLADHVYGQPDFSSTSTRANQGRTNPDALTLDNPTGLALDNQHRLFIADRTNNRILSYPPLAGSAQNDQAATQVYGQAGYNTRDSSTSASTFNGPGAVTIDVAGNLLVLDIFNQRVLKFCNA